METNGPQAMSETARPGYHHGDLRAALLAAAEAELVEAGVEGFSLRACARRAGVSHAAPKHHFGSADGLLDALAATGFHRLAQAIEERAEGVPPPDRLLASGRGYVAFARDNPALFKLMFSAARPGPRSADLGQAGGAAFEMLRADAVAAAPGRSGSEAALDIAAAWALVHGLAHLLIEGPPGIRALLGEAAGEDAIAAVLSRPLPVGAPASGEMKTDRHPAPAGRAGLLALRGGRAAP